MARCKDTTVYIEGIKLRLTQLSVPSPEDPDVRIPLAARTRRVGGRVVALGIGELDPGTTVTVSSPHGTLELTFDPHTAWGRRGRDAFDPDGFTLRHGSDDRARVAYLHAALDAQPAELHEWVENRYSRELLAASRTTRVDGYDLFGYDRLGFDRAGLNRRGFDVHGIHHVTNTAYDPSGFDVEHRSVDGLERPRAWWDEILDVDAAAVRFAELAEPVLEPARHFALAKRMRDHLEREVSRELSIDDLAILSSDMVRTALPTVLDEIASTMPHHLFLARADHATALRTARALSKGRDPDEHAFDRDLVRHCLERRLAGRFALASLRGAALPDVVLDRLADELLEELRADVLLHTTRQRRRAA